MAIAVVAAAFATFVAAAFATFVAAAALPAATSSSATAIAAIAPASVASAWSRRRCLGPLVLVLLQASGVQAQTPSEKRRRARVSVSTRAVC